MRLRDGRAFRGIALGLCTTLTLALGALAPGALAGGLIGDLPNLWTTATALSLTLITAVSANRK